MVFITTFDCFLPHDVFVSLVRSGRVKVGLNGDANVGNSVNMALKVNSDGIISLAFKMCFFIQIIEWIALICGVVGGIVYRWWMVVIGLIVAYSLHKYNNSRVRFVVLNGCLKSSEFYRVVAVNGCLALGCESEALSEELREKYPNMYRAGAL